jgi:hypothetical protein
VLLTGLSLSTNVHLSIDILYDHPLGQTAAQPVVGKGVLEGSTGFWLEEGVLEGSTGFWLEEGVLEGSTGFWLEEGVTTEVLEGSTGFWLEEGVLTDSTVKDADGVGVHVGRVFLTQLRLASESSGSNPVGQGAERMGCCFKQII